jgi:peptidyl-tRNA hydrolase, PTH1 family
VKLIVGLGNPGKEYRETRHNVGFMVADELARRHQLDWKVASVTDAMTAKAYGPQPFMLAKPLTFMNLSGPAVRALAGYFDVEAADVFVIYDDIDLPFGKLRIRAKGSAGTHNGMRSVVAHMGTECPRMRVGVGRGDPRQALRSYVLGPFDAVERNELPLFIARAADAAEMFTAEGILKVMNVYNAGPADPAESN